MKSFVPITCSKQNLTFEKLKQLNQSSITNDWYGNQLDYDWSFCFAKDPAKLFFLAQSNCPVALKPAAQPGQFVKGLWEYTVAEFFLFDSQNNRYQEFNVSPNGSWWSCCFSSCRAELQEASSLKDSVKVFTESTKQYWLAGLAIPIGGLFLPWSPNLRVQTCGVIKSDQDLYLANNNAPSLEADFHRLDLALPFKEVA